MIDESSLAEESFQIVSVQPTKPPPDAQGSDWHCYVIVQGTNTIHGYRQGNLGVVTSAVEEIVAQLNDRRIGKRGRVHLVMPTLKRPKKIDNR
jgi:hypothetical protein